MWEQEKRIVFEASLELKAAGLITGSQGNISTRFKDAGRYLVAITPSGIDYTAMDPADIAVVDASGDLIEGTRKPSIETMLHLAVYARRDDAGAIIHSHSIYATALAVSVESIPPILDDQVFYLGGEIAVARHALPGSGELAQIVATTLGDKNAVLMSNHGALAVGGTMNEALFNCLLLERLSQVYIYSHMLGSSRELPPEVIKKERQMFTGGGTSI